MMGITKLQDDDHTLKRQIEIQLVVKRKLGSVTCTVKKSTYNESDALQWDTYNSVVIFWIRNNVCNAIR